MAQKEKRNAFSHEPTCEPTTSFKGLAALILQSLRLIKKKKENGDTHGTLPSDITVAIAIEIRMEHGNVNEQRECVGI